MKRIWIIASTVCAIAFGVHQVSRPSANEAPRTVMAVLDQQAGSNTWLAHTYPDANNPKGIPLTLANLGDPQLVPGKVIGVTGQMKGFGSTDRPVLTVEKVKLDVPESYATMVEPAVAGNPAAQRGEAHPVPRHAIEATISRINAKDAWIVHDMKTGKQVPVKIQIPGYDHRLAVGDQVALGGELSADGSTLIVTDPHRIRPAKDAGTW